MGAKSGELHHTRLKLAEDKAILLAKVRSGLSVDASLAIVNRKPAVLKAWLADGRFARDLELARADGERALELAIGDNKQKIDFATFSKEFLNIEVMPHQQDWIDVLEGNEPSWLHPSMVYEPSNPNRLLINVPPEHAKSTTITVNYATYLIAMNPNVRIVIVSQTQTRAKEFLYSIKQRLTEEPWAKMQQVYGPAEGYKATSDQWTDHRIYLERESGEKDPTVQALGIRQQIYGARADVIIIDDAVGTTNAHEWEKQMDWLQKMAIPRLGKNGKLIIVGTRVASNDLYREIRNPDNWAGGRCPFTYFSMPAVLEFKDKPKDWVTLWPLSDRPWDGEEDTAVADKNGYFPKWDGPTLNVRRGEVTPSTWAMVYQQQDVESDSTFPLPAVMGSVNRMRKPGPINYGAPGHPIDGNWITVIGFDPAMSGKSGFIAYAFDRKTGERLVLDVFNMADSSPQKIRELFESWIERYEPIELIVEINAHQKSYALDTELNQWLATVGVKMRPHFTGKNKWDTSFGVASLSGLFGSVRDGKHQDDNLIELPDLSNEHIKALTNQLITWKADTKFPTDCLMALWFCELRAKELIDSGRRRMTHVPNRFVTPIGREQQGSANLNDWAFGNY